MVLIRDQWILNDIKGFEMSYYAVHGISLILAVSDRHSTDGHVMTMDHSIILPRFPFFDLEYWSFIAICH